MEVYVFLALSFVISLALQMTVSFQCRKPMIKAFPLVLNLGVILYASARFWGVISYTNDAAGIFDGGLLTGIFLGTFSIASLLGIGMAWVIYLLVTWHRSFN